MKKKSCVKTFYWVWIAVRLKKAVYTRLSLVSWTCRFRGDPPTSIATVAVCFFCSLLISPCYPELAIAFTITDQTQELSAHSIFYWLPARALAWRVDCDRGDKPLFCTRYVTVQTDDSLSLSSQTPDLFFFSLSLSLLNVPYMRERVRCFSDQIQALEVGQRVLGEDERTSLWHAAEVVDVEQNGDVLIVFVKDGLRAKVKGLDKALPLLVKIGRAHV